MVSKKIIISDPLGMHMRPASRLAKMAAEYESSVKVNFNGKAFDCKSVMFLMTACIKYNSEIELVCEGPDEEKALADMVALVESGLGES